MDLRFHRVCQDVEQGLAFEAELVEHSVIDFRAHHPSRSKRNHFQVLSIPPLCLTRGIEYVRQPFGHNGLKRNLSSGLRMDGD